MHVKIEHVQKRRRRKISNTFILRCDECVWKQAIIEYWEWKIPPSPCTFKLVVGLDLVSTCSTLIWLWQYIRHIQLFYSKCKHYNFVVAGLFFFFSNKKLTTCYVICAAYYRNTNELEMVGILGQQNGGVRSYNFIVVFVVVCSI